MVPEPPPLAAAAQRRRESARQRAKAALHQVEATEELISFQSVARRAGVSRQWLYGQPDLRAQIERLRERPTAVAGPRATAASDASLRQRVQTLREEVQRLRDENSALKNELALAYGYQRDAR